MPITKLSLNDIKDIFVSTDSAYILKNDGSLLVSGNNGYGQLGLGDTSDRTSFTQVPRGL